MRDIYSFIPTEIPLPYIGILDKSDSEFLRGIEKKAKDEFGEDSRQYKTIMGDVNIKNGENINLFFTLYVNQNLSEKMRTPNIKDLERILSLNKNYFNDVYCHSSDLILTSDKSHFEKNKYLLENLVSEVKKRNIEFSVKNPLIVSNPKLIVDNNLKNGYGFLLGINENTDLRNDINFNWDNYNKSPLLEYCLPIKNEGTGISISGANGSEIYANEGNLSSSTEDDRLAIIYDVPYEKELISYLEEIEVEKKKLFLKTKKEISEIDKLKRKLT